MPVETRYMTRILHTINGLTAYKLGTTQSAPWVTAEWAMPPFPLTSYFGIRVWKRSVDESETEITAGTPVAIVSRSGAGSGYQSNTWDCPETALASKDAIVVRVYHRFEGYDWDEAVVPKFITEQLGAENLDAATWTVIYWTLLEDYMGAGVSRALFRFGDATYNSRIENFTWTPAPPPPVAKAGLNIPQVLQVITG